ncbi:phenylacetyl-CoA ligase [Mycena rebaudengoi]|nr:phenylacetyl-CoA ligase [Mycena rebaudengoi]
MSDSQSEYGSPAHTVPYFPDNLTIPQFLFDYNHPIQLPREPRVPWIIESVSGKALLGKQLKNRVWGLANALSLKYSLGPEQTVGIINGNDVDYPVAMWATHRLGASFFALNPMYTMDEFGPHLSDMKAALLFVQPSILHVVQNALAHIGRPETHIVLVEEELIEKAIKVKSNLSKPTIQDLVNLGLANQSTHRFVEFKLKPGEGKTKIAVYFTSSGTTGFPKMIAIPHSSFIANIIQTAAHDAGVDRSVPVTDRRFRPGDRSCVALPFFHIFGLLINLHYMLFSGMTVVIIPKFDFVEYLSSIKRYKITNLSLVPPMLTLFCKHPAVKAEDLKSLRVVFIGAAPLSLHLTRLMAKIVPQAIIEQSYGMTELTGILTMPPLNRRLATDAVGHLLPGFAARVVKIDGTLAKPGESGELYVRGPSLALYYANNEKISKETFVDGWVRSGDKVFFDNNHELHIVDRIKDFIKVGGYQVSPTELEARIFTNPDVVECSVIPVPHEFHGEVPKAYVVLREAALERIKHDPRESDNIKAALIQDIADNKIKYKWLTGGVEFIDSIPKTPSGKVLRRVLRAKL